VRARAQTHADTSFFLLHTHRRHTVLPGPSLGDDALLAHALGQQGLAQGIVDLVGACVVEVLTLQVDAGVGAIRPAGAARRAAGADQTLARAYVGGPSTWLMARGSMGTSMFAGGRQVAGLGRQAAQA